MHFLVFFYVFHLEVGIMNFSLHRKTWHQAEATSLKSIFLREILLISELNAV